MVHNLGKDMVDITPDVRLLRVLRNTGFNNKTASGEILDNAVDAGANQIDVFVQEQENKRIMLTFADNGKGMNADNLQYALTLAKELKMGIDQLGKYGMGMKVAALSMTTQMEIFTKTIHGEILYGEFNINKMETLSEYKTTVREAVMEEKEYFIQKTKNARSGTIVVLKNCDRIDVRAETLASQLEEYIGLTYRSYLHRGIRFTISTSYQQGKTIEPIDPLMREEEETKIIRNREAYPISYRAGDRERNTFIEVTAVVLPKTTMQGKRFAGKQLPLTVNQANQGLYFLREGREVGTALTWANVFGERHPSKNRFRIEIIVKSDLDDEIRMNFQKGNVSPTVHLKHQLADILRPVLDDMREALSESPDTQDTPRKGIKRKKEETTDTPIPVSPTPIVSIEKSEEPGNKPFDEITTQPVAPLSGLMRKEKVLAAARTVKEALADESLSQELKNEILDLIFPKTM